MSDTVQVKQDKGKGEKPTARTTESSQKVVHGAGGSTRLPAWTGIWGDHPPVGLISPVADLQAKHIISQPVDPAEQEAEQAANQVMEMVDSSPAILATPPNHPGASSTLAASMAQLSPVPPMIQRAALEEETATAETVSTVPAGLIVEDSVAQPGPGQMKKSDFLAQLRDAVCTTTEQALAGTIWSAAGCPWVDHWFGYYSNRDAQQVERAIRRYAPETANVTSASDYMPIICERVRRAISEWSTTGEVPNLPEGMDVPDVGLMGAAGTIIAGVAGVGSTIVRGAESVASGIASAATSVVSGVGSALSSIGHLFFKGREGGAREVSNPQAIQSQLGTGRSLDGGVRSQMETAFGVDFSHVRVHTDDAATGLSESLNARAFTIGRDVAFGAGEYRPGTLIGDALIAHELAHVVQQGGVSASEPMQKAGAEYNSLEEDADVSAVGAMITLWSGKAGKVANISRNAVPRLKSGLRLQHCGGRRNVSSATYNRYRERFNSLWDTSPYSGMPSDFDPTLSSKGPRTRRARAIFERIYLDDAVVRTDYDANTANIRERIDTYTGPEGLNLISSPRLQNLRTAFSSFTAPVSGAQYPALRNAIQNAANALDTNDRHAVEMSNEWQRVINEYVTADAQRDEIRRIIATPPPVPAPAPAPPPPAPPPAPPPPGTGVTPQVFVDSVNIDGPTAPVIANRREEPVTLTPHSTVANPGVTISTRFTVTPSNRVNGSNVSPDSPWPNAATTGVPFIPSIINTSTVNMHTRLELVNGPVGLLPSTPIPDLTFSVQDNRQSNFIANWFPQISFNDGARQAQWVPGKTVRYIGGTQNFKVGAALPPPLTNPGLTLFVRAQILRGAAVVFIAPPVGQFPPDQDHIPTFAMPISAPAVVPPGGDGLTFKIELLAGDRTTVLSTQNRAISVLPEVTYTQAQAQTEAAADDVHFHDNSPAGLLGIMTGRGGVAARVAAAVNSGFITLTPLTARHDSASYVATVRGAPDPSVVGYFLGSAYVAAAPDAAHSMVAEAGAAGFRLPDRGPRFIAVNRTTDVSTGAKRSDDEIITLTVHEAVHALDVRPGSDTILERYKTEFRAYWMDGRFGPPNQAICLGSPGCRDARFDPSLPPPGPKSPRARTIFEGLYGNITYRYVKTAYDNNTDGFREAVDNYLIPDGINLIASTRLEALRALIDGGVGGSFATFRSSIQAFMGVGVPPPAGVLDADERNEIQRNRAWRDLVDRKVTISVERNQIKSDLGIPL